MGRLPGLKWVGEFVCSAPTPVAWPMTLTDSRTGRGSAPWAQVCDSGSYRRERCNGGPILSILEETRSRQHLQNLGSVGPPFAMMASMGGNPQGPWLPALLGAEYTAGRQRSLAQLPWPQSCFRIRAWLVVLKPMALGLGCPPRPTPWCLASSSFPSGAPHAWPPDPRAPTFQLSF